MIPSISSMNGHEFNESFMQHDYDDQVNNSIIDLEKNTLHDVIVYSIKGQVVEQQQYRFHPQKIMYLYDMMQQIEQMNGSYFKKILLVTDVFDDLDVNGVQSSSSEFVLPEMDRMEMMSAQHEIRGFFGVLYGSFHSDYDDSGFLCLGYPFPFFNTFPLFFTGFGHGDLYFSGILEDESFGTHHLSFDEFVSLFSVFFFGTVVLFPLAYFGFQGFMFGISFICMGSGR